MYFYFIFIYLCINRNDRMTSRTIDQLLVTVGTADHVIRYFLIRHQYSLKANGYLRIHVYLVKSIFTRHLWGINK